VTKLSSLYGKLNYTSRLRWRIFILLQVYKELSYRPVKSKAELHCSLNRNSIDKVRLFLIHRKPTLITQDDKLRHFQYQFRAQYLVGTTNRGGWVNSSQLEHH
jgi:hypothetical protein